MEVGNQTKVTRDDWISRFFGYLGSLKYVYEKNETTSPREWNSDSKGDNIVYIYGVPKGGKSRYREQLSMEFVNHPEYQCCGFDFSMVDRGLTEQHFQLELSQPFAKMGFRFPCLKLAVEGDYNWAATVLGVVEGSVENVEKVVSGNPSAFVGGVKGIYNSAKAGVEYLKNTSPEEKEELKALRAAIDARKKTGSVAELFDSNNPYKFFQLSLAANARRAKKRYICLVDKFELCSQTVQSTEKVLQMMYSVPDIIWVLFSDKNPNPELGGIVPECNCWRMGGLNRERAKRYIKERCPGMVAEWYNAIYENTGGYYGLMDLCVRAQQDPKSRFELPDDWIKYPIRPQDSATVKKEYAERAKAYLEDWLKCVWNGGPWGEEDEGRGKRSHPLKFLFEKEYNGLRGIGGGKSGNIYFLPCLCYLVECSKENVGTVRQFNWKREESFPGLTTTGITTVNEIEANTPFCIEYVEYPDVLYLDPVIVKILSGFDYYEDWLKMFMDDCLLSVSQDKLADKDRENKEQGGQKPESKGLESKNQAQKPAEDNMVLNSTSVPNPEIAFLNRVRGDKVDDSVAVDTKLAERPAEEAKEGDNPDAQQPPAKEANDSQMIINTADRGDGEKDDDLPVDQITEVTVKKDDDNEGEDKDLTNEGNDVSGNKPPDKD